MCKETIFDYINETKAKLDDGIYEIGAKDATEFVKKLKFKIYLASDVIGMGFYQAIDNASIEQVNDKWRTECADYILGRMIKTIIKIDGNKVIVQCYGGEPPTFANPAYQSWTKRVKIVDLVKEIINEMTSG